MKSRPITVSTVMALLATMLLLAQPAPTTPPAAATPAPAAGTATPSLEQNLQEILEDPDNVNAYRYEPAGRRDPFRSLVGPAQQRNRTNAPPGPAGFLIDEMDLQGIFRTDAGFVAMMNGPDNKGYTLRSGDKVFDGEVVRISPVSIVFRQEVNDPTRIERYREVVKEIAQGTRR